jgi:hypothetical protein
MSDSAEINSRKELAWKAWIAASMKMINKQFLGFRLPTIKFNDLNDSGRNQMKQEFDDWWEP